MNAGWTVLFASVLFSVSSLAVADDGQIQASDLSFPMKIQFSSDVSLQQAPKEGDWSGWLDKYSYSQLYSATPGSPTSIPKGTGAIVTYEGRNGLALVGDLGSQGAYHNLNVQLENCTPTDSPKCDFNLVFKGADADSQVVPDISAQPGELQRSRSAQKALNGWESSQDHDWFKMLAQCGGSGVALGANDALLYTLGSLSTILTPTSGPNFLTRGSIREMSDAKNYLFGDDSACHDARQSLAQAKIPTSITSELCPSGTTYDQSSGWAECLPAAQGAAAQ